MGLGGIPKRARIERVERRRLKQRWYDAEWVEENEYERYDAFQALLEQTRARGRVSRTACKFYALFGVW
jgi:hypothetical protein